MMIWAFHPSVEGKNTKRGVRPSRGTLKSPRHHADNPDMSIHDEQRLSRLVDHYVRTFGEAHDADRARYQDMPDLETAIRSAALARTADDKRESHQRRIPVEALSEFEKSLQGLRTKLKSAKDFETLFDLIESQRIDGVGPLTIYDTAVRIGAHLGLCPERVHLHAGVTVGARALNLDTTSGPLSMDDVPAPLRRLSADDVENFLCIYKDALAGGELPGGGSLSCANPQTGCGGTCRNKSTTAGCARRHAA